MAETDFYAEFGAIGVVLVFVIQVLQIVLGYLDKQKRNGKSGDLDPSYWKVEFREAVNAETAEQFREIKSMLGTLLRRKGDE